ncbi:tyrosyl-DNA phosphodiesterase 2-like isoform X2 [Artemia franciscana]|uniref:tyrosyl-DNA phosphodiesterase 2-like isoform X2 n=1 Tax=Artemia franciscana TaxID=6661 RepID=UPI0032DB55D1
MQVGLFCIMSDEEIPEAAECQRLVENFVEITDTNEAVAQCFLQDNHWELERSLEQFFGSAQLESDSKPLARKSSPVPDESPGAKHLKLESAQDEARSSLSLPELIKSSKLTDKRPSHFRFLTWNLDGMEPKCLKIRIKAAAKVIEKEGYDIVFLQEVTEETQKYLETLLPQYVFISANSDGAPYYCITLLKIFCVYQDSYKVLPFTNSVMGRNILQVYAHIGEIKLLLMNVHLESTKEFSTQRIVQLKECFKIANEINDANIIFAGDLNLRDKELAEAGGLPEKFFDAWNACGCKKEYQFTWDCLRNSNHQMPSKFQPRCRFDRVFVKPVNITIADFKLTGIQKISGTTVFPSDHWGVAVNFKLP